MRLLQSSQIESELGVKFGIRKGQLRMWTSAAALNPEDNGCFIVTGFRVWDDSEPTAIILQNGVMSTVYYIDYVCTRSTVIEDSNPNEPAYCSA